MEITTIIFLLRGNEVGLGVKKKKVGKGKLNGWGGKKEGDETPLQTAVREIRQEGGGTIVSEQDLIPVAIIDFYSEGEYIFQCFVYFTKQWVHDPTDTDEMGPVQWFRRDNPPLDRMMKGDALWFGHLQEGVCIFPKVFYTNNFQEVTMSA